MCRHGDSLTAVHVETTDDDAVRLTACWLGLCCAHSSQRAQSHLHSCQELHLQHVPKTDAKYETECRKVEESMGACGGWLAQSLFLRALPQLRRPRPPSTQRHAVARLLVCAGLDSCTYKRVRPPKSGSISEALVAAASDCDLLVSSSFESMSVIPLPRRRLLPADDASRAVSTCGM